MTQFAAFYNMKKKNFPGGMPPDPNNYLLICSAFLALAAAGPHQCERLEPPVSMCVVIDQQIWFYSFKQTTYLLFTCHSSEFGRYTLDVIAATAFGLDTNAIKDPDCIFLRKLKEIFAFTETASIWQKIGCVFYCEYISVEKLRLCMEFWSLYWPLQLKILPLRLQIKNMHLPL